MCFAPKLQLLPAREFSLWVLYRKYLGKHAEGGLRWDAPCGFSGNPEAYLEDWKEAAGASKSCRSLSAFPRICLKCLAIFGLTRVPFCQ